MQSLVTPYGPGASTCGYCGDHSSESPETSYKVASLSAYKLTCDVYQRMIDRGWRRSGTYCYKPNLRVSCCPQYTIRLDALEFKASKSQRKLLNRWNRYIMVGKEPSMDVDEGEENSKGRRKPRHPKLGRDHVFSLETSIHASEGPFLAEGQKAAHQFTVTLEPSSYTEEKYKLFERYQTVIHHDDDNKPKGFERFLVNSPLLRSPIPYSQANPTPDHLPSHYGAYHQMYRVDGKLIAVGVLDILPACVSSVYFLYDPDWDEFSLGKLSALREISLVREMYNAGAPNLRFQYMGFYIQSCQKMRYKGDYSPSYLADPVNYEWYPLSKCTPLLEKYRYACFSDETQSVDDVPDDKSYVVDENAFGDEELGEVQAVTNITASTLYVAPVKRSPQWDDKSDRRSLLSCIEALSPTVAKDVIFLPY